MKKTLCILSVLMFSIVYADVVLAPQWAEFCPSEYLNAQPSKFSSNKTYWADRRIQFEISLKQCSLYSGDDLKSCYNQIRQAEVQKNLQWNNGFAKDRHSQVTQQMNNANNTINTLHHLIDNIRY